MESIESNHRLGIAPGEWSCRFATGPQIERASSDRGVERLFNVVMLSAVLA